MRLDNIDATVSGAALHEAIDAMPTAFALYDEKLELQACNTLYANYHRQQRDDLLGRSLQEVVRGVAKFLLSMDGQPISVAAPISESVLRKSDNLGGQSHELETVDGKWYLASFHATESGGLVSNWFDITAQKGIEQRARATQNQLEDAINSIPNVFALYDDERRLVICNQAYADYQRKTISELTGSQHQKNVAHSHQYISRINGAPIVTEPGDYVAFVDPKPGEERPDREIETLDGQVILANDWMTGNGGFVFVGRDVTTLKREQDRFEDAVEAMPHMFCLWDSNLCLVTCNAAFARYFGRSKETLLGKPAKLLCGYLFMLIDHAMDVFSDGTPTDAAGLLEWLRRPNNQNGEFVGIDGRHFQFTVSPAADGGAVCTGRDVTDLRRAEEELRKQQDTLMQTEKMSALGTMLAGVAHELNNPLSVVVGQTLLMKETATDEKIQRRAELIGNAADRCGRIVKTFLAMARQKPPDSQSVDLNEIVSDTLEVLKYTLGQSAIYVEDSLAENLPMVWGDPDQLGQIILNLVVNAQHALETVEGERRIGITTTDEFDTNTVVLRILDNGPGIPRALQNRIFEPFFTTKEVGLGTGLGLALTRKIVEAHGGSIDLGDTVTGGCSFVVRLPRWEHAAEAKAPDVPSTRPAARSILIVDDEEDVIMTLQDILEFDGHAVVTASSGGAAMKALDEQRFDAVLTDLRMQETDGISLFRHIADAHPGIVSRVAFVTGDTLSPDVRDFLAEAERPILEKPFRPDDVRALISELTNS